MVGIVQPKADPWCCLHFTKYKFNVYRKKYIRSGRDSAVVGIVGKSKSLDFLTMLIFCSLVRNSVVLAVYLLFSVACFFTVHEHQPGNTAIHASSTDGFLDSKVAAWQETRVRVPDKVRNRTEPARTHGLLTRRLLRIGLPPIWIIVTPVDRERHKGKHVIRDNWYSGVPYPSIDALPTR